MRLLDIVVALLQQLLDDVLHVLADITGLSKGGGIGDGEWYIQQARQGFSQQGLARAGRPDQQDIALRDLDFTDLAFVLNALVVVVDGHRQDFLGAWLADHILVEDFADLLRHGELAARCRGILLLLHLLTNDVVAQLDTLVAHEHRRAGNELAHLMLALATERAIQKLFALSGTPIVVIVVCHLVLVVYLLGQNALSAPAFQAVPDIIYSIY